MDMKSFSGPCACGQTHTLATREVLVKAGARRALGDVAGRLGLAGGVVVCDSNTRPFAEEAAGQLAGRLAAQPLVELPAAGLHADEHGTALLGAALPAGAGWLLACGSGTVHDLTRYVAHERGLAFLSYPTAATVDGFVSTVSAMTWYGFKKTLPGVAPLAVVADTEVFSVAPARLTAAGIGDVMGKYTSLADWKIAHLVTGEAYCPRIAALSLEAADAVRAGLKDIAAGGAAGMEKLMEALLLSGIAMQMQGSSRPASGAEHHLSHLWEMEAMNPHVDAMHGEKVGVGLGLVLEGYRRFAGAEAIAVAAQYGGLPHAQLRRDFGRLYDGVIEENTPDPLAGVQLRRLAEVLPAVQEVLRGLPEAEGIRAEMAAAGCPTTMAGLGLNEDLRERSLAASPFVRNRLTFQRLQQLLEVPA